MFEGTHLVGNNCSFSCRSCIGGGHKDSECCGSNHHLEVEVEQMSVGGGVSVSTKKRGMSNRHEQDHPHT